MKTVWCAGQRGGDGEALRVPRDKSANPVLCNLSLPGRRVRCVETASFTKRKLRPRRQRNAPRLSDGSFASQISVMPFKKLSYTL